MATLDAIAELFKFAQWGEDYSAEDGDYVAAMMENNRAMLWGIAASFAPTNMEATMA